MFQTDGVKNLIVVFAVVALSDVLRADELTNNLRHVQQLESKAGILVESEEFKMVVQQLHLLAKRPTDMEVRQQVVQTILLYRIRFDEKLGEIERRLAQAEPGNLLAKPIFDAKAEAMEDVVSFIPWRDPRLHLIFRPEIFLPLAEAGIINETVSVNSAREGLKDFIASAREGAADRYLEARVHLIPALDRIVLERSFEESIDDSPSSDLVGCFRAFNVSGH